MNRSSIGQSFSLLLSGLLAGSCALSPAWSEPPAKEKVSAPVQDGDNTSQKADQEKTDGAKEKEKNWKPLQGLWKECQFGGDGQVEMNDKLIKVHLGDPLTGIRWEGELVRENYELELETRRTDGFDFFCGLTFPVGKDHVSFILGGWGGGVVGISCVDGRDASDNETTSFRNFDNEKWYRVRVRVDANEIQCWIDDKAACEQVRKNHEFDIRYEMDQCVPLGVAAFQCDAEYRNIRWRKLTDEEIAAAKKKAESEEDEK